jgi:hypothetical protein
MIMMMMKFNKCMSSASVLLFDFEFTLFEVNSSQGHLFASLFVLKKRIESNANISRLKRKLVLTEWFEYHKQTLLCLLLWTSKRFITEKYSKQPEKTFVLGTSQQHHATSRLRTWYLCSPNNTNCKWYVNIQHETLISEEDHKTTVH